MTKQDLIDCLYNSAAMLDLADSEPPAHRKAAEWRAACQRANRGQAGLLRQAAKTLAEEGLS